jgi:hypothetical protein
MAEWVVGFARGNRAATDMQDLPAMGKHHRQPAPDARLNIDVDLTSPTGDVKSTP